MSYTRPTLAAFSDAMGKIHFLPQAHPEALQMVGLPGVSESREDLAYLDSLLNEHRVAVAQPRPAVDFAPNRTVEDYAPLRGAGLTRRECEVLFWISEGKQDTEIATILGCAPRTVSKHVEHLLAKLHAETRLGAVHTAQEWLRKKASA